MVESPLLKEQEMPMRVIANSFLALSILVSTQIQPATANGAGGSAQLTKLEQKYLGQVYAAEPEEARVQRLEKFVFGDVSTGDLTQRLAQLASAGNGGTPDDNSADDLIENTAAFDSTQPVDAQTNAPQAVSSSIPQEQQAYQEDQQSIEQTPGSETISSNDQSSAEEPAETPPQGGDQYPRVGDLEKLILGQTYPQQDVAARLNQLETKAYGKTSESAALSDRVDNLEKYADKKYAKELKAQRDKQVYDEDARGREIEPGQGSQVKSKVPGLVNMVSNVLFGGPGMMGNPYMGGPSIGGVGFGGVHMRDRSEVAKQEALEAAQAGQSSPTARAAARQEDPVVHASTPPPATAKMLTKVAWCEMKLFGHTSPEMHLPERLQQLNDTLNYKPGKRGIALMDDVNAMVSAVAAKNGGSIGSVGNPIQ
jgi:hypothetical protein